MATVGRSASCRAVRELRAIAAAAGLLGLLIAWFGFGDASKIWLLFFAAFPPIAWSDQWVRGVPKRPDRRRSEPRRQSPPGAPPVLVPATLPEMFTGIRVSIGLRLDVRGRRRDRQRHPGHRRARLPLRDGAHWLVLLHRRDRPRGDRARPRAEAARAKARALARQGVTPRSRSHGITPLFGDTMTRTHPTPLASSAAALLLAPSRFAGCVESDEPNRGSKDTECPRRRTTPSTPPPSIGYQAIPNGDLIVQDQGILEAGIPDAKIAWTVRLGWRREPGSRGEGPVDIGLAGSGPVSIVVSAPLALQVSVVWIHDVIGKAEALVVKDRRSPRSRASRARRSRSRSPRPRTTRCCRRLADAGRDSQKDVDLIDLEPEKMQAAVGQRVTSTPPRSGTRSCARSRRTARRSSSVPTPPRPASRPTTSGSRPTSSSPTDPEVKTSGSRRRTGRSRSSPSTPTRPPRASARCSTCRAPKRRRRRSTA